MSDNHVAGICVAILLVCTFLIGLMCGHDPVQADENKQLRNYLNITLNHLEAETACAEAQNKAQRLHDEQLRLRKGGRPHAK